MGKRRRCLRRGSSGMWIRGRGGRVEVEVEVDAVVAARVVVAGGVQRGRIGEVGRRGGGKGLVARVVLALEKDGGAEAAADSHLVGVECGAYDFEVAADPAERGRGHCRRYRR